MHSFNQFIEAIRAGDLSDACISAALDCYQDECNATLTQAVCSVAALVNAYLDELKIKLAKKNLWSDTSIGIALRATTLSKAGVMRGEAYWTVSNGWALPHIGCVTVDDTGPKRKEVTEVRVGADWIMEEVTKLETAEADSVN